MKGNAKGEVLTQHWDMVQLCGLVAHASVEVTFSRPDRFCNTTRRGPHAAMLYGVVVGDATRENVHSPFRPMSTRGLIRQQHPCIKALASAPPSSLGGSQPWPCPEAAQVADVRGQPSNAGERASAAIPWRARYRTPPRSCNPRPRIPPAYSGQAGLLPISLLDIARGASQTIYGKALPLGFVRPY